MPLIGLGILILIFAVLNLFLYFKLGIKVANDSPRYINYASNILENGFYFDPHEFWYISYPLFLILVKSVHNSFEAIVLAQYLLSFTGLICLYLASLKLFENHLSAFITGLLYVGFFEISIYNSYILCESLYLSSLCISFFFLSKWYKKEFSVWSLVLGFSVILFTCFVKPTGIALIGALVIIGLFKVFTKLESKPLKIIGGIIILIPFIFLLNKMLTPFGFMNDYSRGELIFGMFQYTDSPFYNSLTIVPPKNLYFPNEDYPALIRLSLFIIHHPIYWTQLFFGKLFYLFAHIRPFWSTAHNIFSLTFLLPAYWFFIKGIKSGKTGMELRLFALTYINIHALSVGMLTDDWDGRFLLPILVMVFLFSGYGFGFSEKIRNQMKPFSKR